jgi:glycine dehydrogenase
MQTREQHIRREKATSNICTAQVLLAIMAGMYAVFHGPRGLRRIAERVHGLTATLAAGLRGLGWDPGHEPFFDTLRVTARGGPASAATLLAAARAQRINLREYGDGTLGLALDEATTPADVQRLLELFGGGRATGARFEELAASVDAAIPPPHARASEYLTQEVFQRHHSEHEMLRYLYRLQGRDLSLTHSMIPLGSCTMKLNAASELLPISWPELAGLHPFAPPEQWRGYSELFTQLESWPRSRCSRMPERRASTRGCS